MLAGSGEVLAAPEQRAAAPSTRLPAEALLHREGGTSEDAHVTCVNKGVVGSQVYWLKFYFHREVLFPATRTDVGAGAGAGAGLGQVRGTGASVVKVAS